MQNIIEKTTSLLKYGSDIRINGIEITLRSSDFTGNPFEETLPSDGRPCLIVTGHNSWQFCDVNLTDKHEQDRGRAIAKAWYKEQTGKVASYVIPVWLYRHGGARIETQQSCNWDSGFLGFVCFHKGWYRRPGMKGNYTAIAKSTIEDWNSALNGECYGYDLSNHDGVSIDSCGGFLGDWEKSGLVDCLVEDNEIECRLFADDNTLTIEDCLEYFGEELNEAVGLSQTFVGSMARAYLFKKQTKEAEEAKLAKDILVNMLMK